MAVVFARIFLIIILSRQKHNLKDITAYENKNKTMTVRFHWSMQVIIITCISLFFIIGGILYVSYTNPPPEFFFMKLVINIPIIAILLYCFSLTPFLLSVDCQRIKIHKHIHSISIPLENIESIEELSVHFVESSICAFGSGGLFGYLGKFKNKRMGNYWLYATEMKNLIIVKTSEETYVFSCVKSKEFLSKVEILKSSHSVDS